MRRAVAVVVVIACAASALPASAGAQTLSVSKTKRMLYAYAQNQKALDFSVRYCRRRSPRYVRCIVRETFVEPIFGSQGTYDASERYPMAVKLRRRTPHALIWDDIKDGWVRWSGPTP